MTEAEFLEWLSALSPMVEWTITDDGKIRSTMKPEEDCPVTHVARALTTFQTTPGHYFPDTAARALGLRPGTVDRVVKAADDHDKGDLALRTQLMASCDLNAAV